MNETFTCVCGETFESRDDLKKHNLKAHGDEMADEVDRMEPDQNAQDKEMRSLI